MFAKTAIISHNTGDMFQTCNGVKNWQINTSSRAAASGTKKPRVLAACPYNKFLNNCYFRNIPLCRLTFFGFLQQQFRIQQ
jgi:hypothetical protein